jgi:hypothetical protein
MFGHHKEQRGKKSGFDDRKERTESKSVIPLASKGYQHQENERVGKKQTPFGLF